MADRRRYAAMLDSVADWRPPELPQLDQFDEIIMDLETTGLRWWDGDKMIGAGLWTPDGQYRYLPIRHKVGVNIPEEQFFRWMKHEVRGKKITNIRTKFDLHMTRVDGIDLEAQDNTFGDVAHYAALLDDHRIRFNQHDLAATYLPEGFVGKVTQAHGYELDPTKFAEYPAGLVAPRACSDVLVVAALRDAMWPLMTDQGLHEVRKIEEQIIPVVVEMEHNGAPLNVELLDRWVKESARDLDNLRRAIKKGTGIEFEKFSKHDTMLRLFHQQGVAPTIDPDEPDKVSFADALLKPIKNRWIRAARAGRQLESLRSKFLLKYQSSTMRDGILRYELHQVPYQDDDDGGYGGAVSGRFSSAAPSRDEGANIQQVFGVDIQKTQKPFTRKYIVKKLFITGDPAAQYVNADASQLQLRIFAHYGDDERIIRAYDHDRDWEEIDRQAAEWEAKGISKKKWPDSAKLIDYHDVVGNMIREFAKIILIRTHVKNVNFAQVFGAGVPKMAFQVGCPRDQIPTSAEWGEAVRKGKTHEVGGPLFQEIVKLSETYHELFPAVKPLLAVTSHLAMPGHKTDEKGHVICGRACRKFYADGLEHRGWVKTIAGRRARFRDRDRFYSALNRIIQGTEGDYIKRVMIAVHAERKSIGLLERFTVHDAIAGDLYEDPIKLKRVLNATYYDFKVPIRWEVGVGKTWADAK